MMLLRIRRRSLVAALAGWLALVALPSVARGQAQPRDLYVSVVAQDELPVSGLEVGDFIVREDGVAREVLRVRPATEPMQIALLVDNTQAMDRETANVRDALKAFVTKLGGRHAISVIGFADRPTLLVDATTDPNEVVKRGVLRVFPQPNSGSYLLDAIVDTTKGFLKQEASRPVVVAVTFEGVEFSTVHHDQVIDALLQAGAPLFVQTVGTPGSDALDSQEGRSRAIVLDRGTRESGGRQDNVLTAQALKSALEKLARVLDEQYLVTYARPDTLIPPKKVEVAVNRPGLDARGAAVKSSTPRRSR